MSFSQQTQWIINNQTPTSSTANTDFHLDSNTTFPLLPLISTPTSHDTTARQTSNVDILVFGPIETHVDSPTTTSTQILQAKNPITQNRHPIVTSNKTSSLEPKKKKLATKNVPEQKISKGIVIPIMATSNE